MNIGQLFGWLALASTALISVPPVAMAQTNLEFTTWQADEAGFGDFWREAIAAFEADNPDVNIEIQQIPFADYINQLTIRFASGQPPHIVALNTSSFGIFAEQGWLRELDSLAEGTPIDTEWSSLQEELVWDGTTYGVLMMGYGFMLFYNSEILEQAGIEVPQSFDEFRTAVAAATDVDSGIFGLAAVTTEHPTLAQDFIRFIEWQDQRFIVDGNYNLTDPGVVAAIENYRETVGENAPLGNNSTIARQLFTDGRTAFLIDGPWMYANFENASGDVRPNLEMVAAPFSPPLGGASNSIHLPDGLDPEIEQHAWAFIEYLARDDMQERYLVLTASPSGRADVLSDDAIEEMPHLSEIAQAADGALPIIPNERAIRANANEFNAILQRTALRVLSTEEPVESILADAQQELERTIPLSE